jgi:very-short-patch-repair endonuclease
MVVDGIPVTTVPRLLADLAAMLDKQQLKRVWQEAQRVHRFDVNAVKPFLHEPRKGIGNLTALVEEAEDAPDTRSEFEHRFHDFLSERPDIPKAAYNVALHGYVVDAAWLSQGLIVELDSRGFHWHRAEEDFDRDAELLTYGYRTYHVTWRALTREPEKLAGRLRRLLKTTPSPTPAARADGA